MLLNQETKDAIKAEYNSFKEHLYAGKTLEERQESDQFFTPPEITIPMIEKFDCDSLSGKNILDPTSGSGNLLVACLIAGADPDKLFGNEYDPAMVKLCRDRIKKVCKERNLEGFKDYQKHQVKSKLLETIRQFANLNLAQQQNKNILLIGQYDPSWIATFAMNNNITILHDSADQIHIYSYEPLNNKIVYINNIGELNMSIKFDYIIANPPYKIGNEITRFIIDNVNFNKFINLMPLSKYQPKQLFTHVKDLQIVPSDLFDGAIITDNLCIADITKESNKISYQDILIKTYNAEFKDFYLLNRAAKNKVIYLHGAKESTRNLYNRDKDWMMTWYICNANKAHNLDGDSFDVKYNVLKTATNDDIMDDKCGKLSVCIIRFSSKQEKDNFNRYFYYNKLAYELIVGLNKNGGTAVDAIPNINYSVDRDYEHITLEDIMNILREENPDVA